MAQVIHGKKPKKLTPYAISVAQSQVKREREHARYIITVDEIGNPVGFKENTRPQINVLAVIGPAQVGDVNLKETILLEIGRNRSYPYRKTYGMKSGSKPKVISERKKFASLSHTQLRNVFPKISEVLISDMKRRTKDWVFKYGGYKTRHLFKGDRNPERVVEIGTRYSVSHFDETMLASILQSERVARPVPLLKDLAGASHYINAILRKFPVGEPTKKEFNKFLKKRAMIHLFEWFDRRGFQPHHFGLLDENLKSKDTYGMFVGVLEHLKVDMEKAETWTALFKKNDMPTFEGVQIYIPACKWTEKKQYRKRYKKFVTSKNKPTYLVFQLQDHGVPF